MRKHLSVILFCVLFLPLSYALAADPLLQPDETKNISPYILDASLPSSDDIVFERMQRLEKRKKLNIIQKTIQKSRTILDSLREDRQPNELSKSYEGLSEEEIAINEKLQEWLEESEPFDLILTVRRKGKAVSGTIIALQKGMKVFLPINELSGVLRLKAESDLLNQRISGFAVTNDSNYSIDLTKNIYVVGNETLTLPQDTVIVKDFGDGLGDFYTDIDLLNDIWGLNLTVDFSSQNLFINTSRLLPVELAQERNERQKVFADKQEEEVNENFEYTPNTYKMLGKPAFNVATTSQYTEETSTFRSSANIKGTSELLGTTAEYNSNIVFDNSDGFDVKNPRLELTRRADYGNELPAGLRILKAGDVTSRAASLIDSSITGRGVSVSNAPFIRNRSFDRVTIEGKAQPGWDVEVYAGRQLQDFGTVEENGEYRFEDVQLFYGKNDIRIVLYGPEGQVEEKFETYNIDSDMLTPGETIFETNIVDRNNPLIDLEDDPERPRDGLYYATRVQTGLTENISPFASATSLNTEEGRKNYISAGANFSALGGTGQIEAFKDLEGGTALDTRYTTRFSGLRLTAQNSIYNDFESPEANFDDSRKIMFNRVNLSTGYKIGSNKVGLNLNASRTDFENDRNSTNIQTTQSFRKDQVNITNRFNTRLQENKHQNTSGSLNMTGKINDFWSARSQLSYDVYPETNLDRARFIMRYRDREKFTSAFEVNHSLNKKNTTYGVDASYDFGEFIAGARLDWNTEEGVDASIRTITSLAPLNEDGTYQYDSESLTGKTALRSRVFHDINQDNVFSDGDIPLKGVKLRVNGKQTPESDEDGFIYAVSPSNTGLATIRVDETTLENELMVSYKDAYQTVLRPVSTAEISIPVVISGAVNGRVNFPDGRAAPTLKIKLINSSGELVNETITDFAGYYNFEYIRPGNYTIQTDGPKTISNALQNVVITQTTPFMSGIDMEVASLQSGQKGLGKRIKNIISIFEKRNTTI